VRLWASQAVSTVGDWAFGLAVATVLSSRSGGADLARTMGLLVAAQVGPSALFGLTLAGPIVDRMSRTRLMVVADLARLAAVGSLLLVPSPSVVHLVLVAACLGVFGALFQPSMLASVPNVVAQADVVAASAVMTTTSNVATLVGPALGALLVAMFGAGTAFALNALSFGVSAAFVASVRIREVRVDTEGGWTPLRDLVAGARYMAGAELVRGIMLVMVFLLFFSAMNLPIETVLVRDVLTDGTAARVAMVLGALTAAWGAGMVFGSFLAPGLSGRWPRERLLIASIAVVGASLVLASRTMSFVPVLGLWVCGGAGMGCANVAYESLLQERTPDHLRGRVFAAIEAVQDAAFFLGATAVGLTGQADPRRTYAAIGVAFVGCALLAFGLLGAGGRVDGETVADLPPGLEVEIAA